MRPLASVSVLAAGLLLSGCQAFTDFADQRVHGLGPTSKQLEADRAKIAEDVAATAYHKKAYDQEMAIRSIEAHIVAARKASPDQGQYDPNVFCAGIGQQADRRYQADCLRTEQIWYNYIKDVMPTTPRAILLQCDAQDSRWAVWMYKRVGTCIQLLRRTIPVPFRP